MKIKVTVLAVAALAGAGAMGWGAHDVIGAQMSKPTMMQRIYTGADGQSHVENIPLDVKSMMEKITGIEVKVSPPGRVSDYHVGPQRQYIINLTGSGQLELADGKVDFPPGSIEYIDDLTGKGHITRTTSSEDRVSLWLKFEDQTQRIGPLKAK